MARVMMHGFHLRIDGEGDDQRSPMTGGYRHRLA